MTNHNINQKLFEQAQQYIAGGVNSPVRAFNGVGGIPIFFKSAQGAYLTSNSGKKYLDYVGSWGPMIAGHNHPQVIAALKQQLEHSISFGAPCEQEITLAQMINTLMPAMEMIRMVNSGTEATMSAIRLARGFTNRKLIIKFEGCYHGHSDGLLVKAGSGALTLGEPNSKGIPAEISANTLCLTYNDIAEVQNAFAKLGNQIAGVIVEPIAGNMNLIPAKLEFLQNLRSLCDQYQSVLIFDEVMSGFRVALGGATEIYGIKPDLITLGKIIGGGLPVGAFGGRREIMELLAPLGGVYQAGTLSGNPLAMTAGIATLKLIQEPNFYQKLNSYNAKFMQSLQSIATYAKIPFITNHVGGMFGFLFIDPPSALIKKLQGDFTSFKADNFYLVNKSNFDHPNNPAFRRFKQFYHLMLEQEIYFPPSAFEAGFISSAHGDKELQTTLKAAEYAFSKLT